MTKPNLIDVNGRTWIPTKNGYCWLSSSTPASAAEIERYYGPVTEEKTKKEEKSMKATVVKTFILCPECDEEYSVSVTLSRVEDGVWEPRLLRNEGDKGQRAHRCEVPLMEEPEVGTIVTVNGKYFVRVIRKGAHSSHDWIDLQSNAHITWKDVVFRGKPSLGYYGNTLEY